MFDEELSRLEQVIMEDAYGKHNNQERVLQDMQSGLKGPINKAVDLINEYFAGSYWETKNARVAAVSHMDPMFIIQQILLVVLPCKYDLSYQQVVSPLANYFHREVFEDLFDGVKTAAELVAVVCFSDLYNIIPANISTTGSLMVRSNYSLSPQTKAKLEKTRYLPPLITLPNKITSNYSSGYLTKKESVILGRGNQHNEKLALDVLNRLNSVQLSLDEGTLEYEEEYVEPSKAKRKDLTVAQLRQRKANHKLMAETSTEIYNEMLDKGNKFYITWKYDKRGRVYSAGYHINIQATDYKKSLLNLAKKEIIDMGEDL